MLHGIKNGGTAEQKFEDKIISPRIKGTSADARVVATLEAWYMLAWGENFQRRFRQI